MKSFHVLFGIDMETDVGSFTPFYEGARNGTPLLLDLFAKKGIKGTFFFTGDCARRNPDIAKTVANSGNEVGCHSLYHETIGDELFPIPGVYPLLSHEVKPRLELCRDWVQEAAGVKTTSFRCPRLWGSTAVVNALEELGFTCDVSYPMYFYRQQFSPYHPDRADWTKKGDSSVLEVPNFADMTMQSKDPGLERDRDQWPLFRTEGAEYILKKSASFIEFCNKKGIPAVLAYYIHPWEFWPMKTSYHFGEATVIPDEFITKNCGPIALVELEKQIDGLARMGAEFVTARDLAKLFA
ncbi:MAG TPA: polysaccharide deacetylase family protein [Rectinema sp.]|nr:polysaccharide deacetylase family protein [Rectinema sp.]